MLPGLNPLILSIEACESVKISTECIDCGVTRRAVHIAINSALVDDGHIVEAQLKVILSDGIIQLESIIGTPSGVHMDWSSEPSV